MAKMVNFVTHNFATTYKKLHNFNIFLSIYLHHLQSFNLKCLHKLY